MAGTQANRAADLAAIKRWLPLLVLVLSLSYLTVGLNRWLEHYDEAVVNVAAERVLGGELPYRDFWTCYAPGEFYLVAGAFKLFGISVLTARLVGVGVMGLLLLVVYLTGRQLAGEVCAWLAWLLTLTWWTPPATANAVPTALLLGLGSVACFVIFLQRRGRWLWAAGLLVGLEILFRHDLGIYTALAETATLAVYLRTQGMPARVMGAFVLPLAVVVLPVAAYFLATVPWRELVFDFWIFPTEIYSQTRHLPFPTLASRPSPLTSWWLLLDPGYARHKLGYMLPFYFPAVVYTTTLAGLARRVVRTRLASQTPWFWASLLLVLLGSLSLNYVRVRPAPSHLLPFALPAMLLLGLLLVRLWRGRCLLPGWRWAGLALGVASVVILATPGLSRTARILSLSRYLPPPQEFAIPRAVGMTMEPPDAAYQAAVAWILSEVPPAETIFVGCIRHDQVFTNDVMFYFLAQRPCATRYHELHPGVATTARVQEEIIRELETRQTRFAIVNTDVPPIGEYVGPPDSKLLDVYLQARFDVAAMFNESPTAKSRAWLILERKAES